jgi:hypothetical protein
MTTTLHVLTPIITTSCACGDGGGSNTGLHKREYIYFFLDFFLIDARVFGVLGVKDFMRVLISFFIIRISLLNCRMIAEFMVMGEFLLLDGDICNNNIKK